MLPIEATKEDIIGMFDKGKSQEEVARLCHITGGTLRRHMKVMGIRARTRKEADKQGKITRYRSNHQRKITFEKTLMWVDSLTEMPTEDEIKGYSNLTWKPLDIREMIETRPERELPVL